MKPATGYLHACRTVLAFLLLGVFCCCVCADISLAAASRRDWRETRKEEPAPPPPPPLTPQSFSSAIVLDGRQGSVLSFPLPEGVYRGLQRQDFADICVFDSQGTPVPFSLSDPQAENTRHSLNLTDIPLYPWRMPKEKTRLPMKTDVEIDTSGGIVRIRTQGGEGAAPGGAVEAVAPKPTAYLLDLKPFLDASAQTKDIHGNTFGPRELRSRFITLIPENSEPFVCSLSIKTSDDLTAWRGTGKNQALARLNQAGLGVERLDIALPDGVERYLLLEIQGEHPGFGSVWAEATFSKSAVPVMESIVYGEKSADGKNVVYTPSGTFALTGIDFDLPQSEIMAVRLDWRNDPRGEWRTWQRGTIYRLEKDGAVLRNAPFAPGRGFGFPLYWRLTATGDIPFGQAPGLRLLWTQHSLLFLARGQGPWTLAYGRKAPVNMPALPLGELGGVSPASVISEAPAPVATAPVAPPPATEPEIDKTQWILWAALGVAVLFLSGLALYMMQAMKKKSEV